MKTIDEIIRTEEEKLTQLKNRKMLDDQKASKKERKKDSLQKVIFAETIFSCNPKWKRFQPKTNKKDTIAEFAPVKRFFTFLAEDEVLFKRIWNHVNPDDDWL